jgi:Toprim domain-containing protein/CHC2-type zinc finger protein
MQLLTANQAKTAVSIVDYLASFGVGPDSNRSNSQYLFYLSPLRPERTPSLKVDPKLNLYYDHGIGQGGSVIDLVMALYGCSLPDALEKLTTFVSFHRMAEKLGPCPIEPAGLLEGIQQGPFAGEKGKIRVLSARSLSAAALLRYLAERRIPIELADRYCKEVWYELGGRQYYAIGFPNGRGGYELRNAYFKGSSSPKASTFLEHQAGQIAVFEGFFSFLSYQTLNRIWQNPHMNYLVLNSLAFVETSKPLMERYQQVNLYLDQDDAGRKRTQELLASCKIYQDRSSIYQGHKDLNDWMIHLHRESQSLSHARNIARQIEHARQQNGYSRRKHL